MSAPQPLIQPTAESADPSPWKARNVRVYFYLTLTMLVMWSFSFSATFDAYLLELARALKHKDPNVFVGTVESVRGITTLVLALPIGWISDKMNRRTLMKISSIFGTAAVTCSMFGILFDLVSLLYVGVVMSALFMQVFMTNGQALLADSVPKAKLQGVVASSTSLYLLGYSIGPLAQAILAAIIGNTWNLGQLHAFLCSGFVLWPLIMPAFYCFEKTLTEREAENRTASEQVISQSGDTSAALDSTQMLEHWYDKKVIGIKKKWLVPILLEVSNLMTAMGAGMTVKFFALFFKEDYGFKPIELNFLQAGYTVSIALCVQLCRSMSKKMGPMQAALTWHILGTSCLFGFWLAQPLPLVIFLYLVRGGFMNSIGPICQALIMECVDTKYRGRWSALQSFARISWSGSAILGGLLADSHDYRYAFFITAMIYSGSAVFYIPLILLVPAKRADPSPSAPQDPKASMVSLQEVDASEEGAQGS